MYQNFIGIDISKDSFAVAIHGNQKVFSFDNNLSGFNGFNKRLKKELIDSFVVLETTGGYEVALTEYLQEKRIDLHKANTNKVKNFIRSYGTLAKTDKIDALGLALYGYERHPKLKLFVENPYKKLLKLVLRRNDIKQILVQEKNRLQAPDQFLVLKSIEKHIEFLTKEMDNLNNIILELCKSFKSFENQIKVLKTIQGIGDITAIQLLALLPELGTLDRKRIASLAGLAPHPFQSGRKDGYRKIKGGRSEIKPVLFLAAMTASRSKSSLGDFYRHLVASGKKKMVALTALMRKILVIANARIRDYQASIIPNSQHG